MTIDSAPSPRADISATRPEILARPMKGHSPDQAKLVPPRLRKVLSLNDFEALAKAFLPRPIFGYLSGGVEDNWTRERNREAFSKYMLMPSVLVDVSGRQVKAELLGSSYTAPFGIAPMGICALSCFDGDVEMAKAAEMSGIPFVLSGASLTPLERIAEVAPTCSWFQAYIPGEFPVIESVIERVLSAGFRNLVVTVDTQVLANRENNFRSGFSTPIRPSLYLAADAVMHPKWLFGTMLRTLLNRGIPHFENIGIGRGEPIISSKVIRQFGLRDQLSWAHMKEIRRLWPNKLIVKGILKDDDVRRCEAMGADAVILSSHGGRQLDSVASPFDVLQKAANAKGRMALILDSGVRRGTDVLKALSLGADFTLIGRPMIYAAAVGGSKGVVHAYQLLKEEIDRDMAMLGVKTIEELTEDHLFRVD